MAVLFTRDDFFAPTVEGVDTMNNRHANTMLAQVDLLLFVYSIRTQFLGQGG